MSDAIKKVYEGLDALIEERDRAIGDAAAWKEQLELTLDTCPNCGGSGQVEVPERCMCVYCDGSGMVSAAWMYDRLEAANTAIAEAQTWFANHFVDEDGEPEGLSVAQMLEHVFKWGDSAWCTAGGETQKRTDARKALREAHTALDRWQLGGDDQFAFDAFHILAAALAIGPKVDTEPDGRDPVCVEAWPECEEGAYHPSCCRFPKSCSCTIVHRP